LRVAGATRPIFTEGAIKEIYRRSGGIPRLINIICDNALLNGYALDQEMVDEKSVQEVSDDLKIRLRNKFDHRWIVPLVAFAVGGIVFLYLNHGGYIPLIYQEILNGFKSICRILVNGFNNILRAFN